MSYDISLNVGGAPCRVDRHEDGGVYTLGGTTQADLNVTYNYAPLFDFKDLDGKTGAETADALQEAVMALGTIRDPDYWKPTPGNAGYACAILLRWARQHPDGIWEVS